MKRVCYIISSLIIAIIILSTVSITAFAEEYSGSCGKNVTYMLDTSSGVLTISGTGAMTDYSSSSYVPWYDSRSSITTVEIEHGVTSIGKYAFSNCDGLTGITIPSSVTSVGSYAFNSCDSLTSITVDSNNQNYSSQDGVLFNKDKTNLIQYPIGNTRASYTIPNGVTSIGSYAFYGCRSLTSVTIPDSVTNIGGSAFSLCSKLKSVTIGSNVTSIGDEAFYWCMYLESISIPSSVTSIGDEAFLWCIYLKSISIPSSVTSIGYQAFGRCDGLTSITVDENNLNYSSQDGVLFNKNKTELIQFPASNTKTSYTIPDSVVKIVDYAFWFNSRLVNITIPDSVINIGEHAFYSSDKLNGITIPDSVTSIGDSAFQACKNLTNITVDENNFRYSSEDGILFNKDKTTLIQYPIGNARTSYTIPNSVTSIGYAAFRSCSSLTSVIVPNSVTNIGANAFYYCESLTIITILNPNCEIYNSSLTIYNPNYDSIEIIGYSGSTAQTYAEKYGRTFCDITTVEHTYTTEVVPPTCIEKGYTIYTCIECGYTFVSDFIDSLGHSYIRKITQPTCATQGYTTYTCEVCGETYIDDYTETIPHSYISTVVEPTCTVRGYTQYTCQNCSYTYKSDYVDALGHTYIYTDSPMTEMRYGYRMAKCEVCGNKEYFNLSVPEIKVGETKEISFTQRKSFVNYDDEGRCMFKYTPDKDITVTFRSTGDIGVGGRVVYGFTGEDFEGELCSDNYDNYTHSVNPIINERNFSVTCDLKAGVTYGFTAIAGDQYTSGSYSVTLESDDVNIISTDVQNITAGEQISVPVKISNNDGIMGFKLMFEYDASVLTPVSVTAGDIISTGLDNNLEGDAKPGAFNVYWYSTENMYDDGTLFYLNFNVNDDAIGSTVINTFHSQADTFSESSQGNIVDTKLICSPFELKIDNPNYQKYYISQLVSYDSDENEISAVTGGDEFNISLKFVDGTNDGNDLTKAVFNIEYDTNNFEFVGFADETGKMLSYSSNNNDVKIQMNGTTVYDYYNKSKALCSLDKLRLVFKANELATEGSYDFNYSITDYEGVSTAEATGLSLGLIASQESKNTTVKIDSSVIGQYGDTITVPVSISNNHGLMGYGLTLNYNPDELEFVSAKSSSLFGGSLYYNEDASVGEVYVVWFANNETDANGNIFDLSFQVNTYDNVRSEIAISYSQEDTFNGNYEDVVMNCVGATITLNSEEEHLYEAIIVEPTCETEGYTEYVCTTCSDTYRDTYVSAKGHLYKCTDCNNEAFKYQCTDCSNQITKSVSDVYALWDIKYVNKVPNRTVVDNSCFLDVKSDNIINAKDFALINKSKS